MGDVGSKTKSEGQIIEIPCEHSRSHNLSPIFIKVGQDLICIMSGQKQGQ